MLAIGTQKENLFFGFTDTKLFSEFIITIPKVTQDIIDDDEKEIKIALETIKRRLNNR